MDYKKFIEDEIGGILKKMPIAVQAEMNSFIQEIGSKLTRAIDKDEDVEKELFDLHAKTKENLKKTINEHNKLQKKYANNSSK